MNFTRHEKHRSHQGGPWGNNHLQTDHIQINSRICLACGQCIKECPRGVIGQVKCFRHAHAHIDRADQCIGCKKCVKACPSGAIAELVWPGPGGTEGSKTAARSAAEGRQRYGEQCIVQVS